MHKDYRRYHRMEEKTKTFTQTLTKGSALICLVIGLIIDKDRIEIEMKRASHKPDKKNYRNSVLKNRIEKKLWKWNIKVYFFKIDLVDRGEWVETAGSWN